MLSRSQFLLPLSRSETYAAEQSNLLAISLRESSRSSRAALMREPTSTCADARSRSAFVAAESAASNKPPLPTALPVGVSGPVSLGLIVFIEFNRFRQSCRRASRYTATNSQGKDTRRVSCTRIGRHRNGNQALPCCCRFHTILLRPPIHRHLRRQQYNKAEERNEPQSWSWYRKVPVGLYLSCS